MTEEDERGFTPDDYAHTAELLRSNEAVRNAAASNNHNIILAALDRCATTANAHAGLVEALRGLLDAYNHVPVTGSVATHKAISDARFHARNALLKAQSGPGEEEDSALRREGAPPHRGCKTRDGGHQ